MMGVILNEKGYTKVTIDSTITLYVLKLRTDRVRRNTDAVIGIRIIYHTGLGQSSRVGVRVSIYVIAQG